MRVRNASVSPCTTTIGWKRNMSRPLLWSYVFFALAAGSLEFVLFEPYIWSNRIPGPNAPRNTASIVYAELAKDMGPTAGLPFQTTIITNLQIEYTETISETQSAQISVQVKQLEKIKHFTNPRGPLIYSDTGPSELPELVNSVHMSLESSDFDFGQDKDGKPGNDRFLPKGSPIPTKLTWSPTPRRSGQTTLLLRLKNVRTA